VHKNEQILTYSLRVTHIYGVTTDNNLVTSTQYGFYKWWKFDSCLLAC